jgi:hypothetical protein
VAGPRGSFTRFPGGGRLKASARAQSICRFSSYRIFWKKATVFLTVPGAMHGAASGLSYFK